MFAALSFHNSYNSMIYDSHFSSTFYAAKLLLKPFLTFRMFL